MREGDRVKGYLVGHRIGEGGMSIVHIAENQHTGEQVVLKVLKDEFVGDPDFVTRFMQEAHIMGRLQHPNLARVMDYIEHNGDCILVEEYLAGGSLADRMTPGVQIPERLALQWCRDALHGIDCAHRDGVLHRDVKPGNLMFDEAGTIKVTDFGIAKVFGGPKLTRTRSEMGTPAYMSPEQIRVPSEAYHLTDVYSMGVVLYELLTNRVPFERDGDFDTKQAVVKEPPPPPRRLNPKVSPELQDIVLTALHKDPSERYGGCAEFSARIDDYLNGKKAPSEKGWFQRHPFATATFVIFAVLMLLIIASNLHASVLKSSTKPAPGRPIAVQNSVDHDHN